MTTKNLNEQLDEIDQEMATLDDRRTALIRRISNSTLRRRDSSKILESPGRVTVRRYAKNPGRPNPWN